MLFYMMMAYNRTSSTGGPPSLSFIEQHLSVCRGTSYTNSNNATSSSSNNSYDYYYGQQQNQSMYPSWAGPGPSAKNLSNSSANTSIEPGSSSSGTVSTTNSSAANSNPHGMSTIQHGMYTAQNTAVSMSVGSNNISENAQSPYGHFHHPMYGGVPPPHHTMYPPHPSHSTATSYPPHPYGAHPISYSAHAHHPGANYSVSSANPTTATTNNSNISLLCRPGSLAQEEDRLLLTDYFFYLMQQLQTCHFSECDRKTRGGKRDNIAIGYAGLQCVHCSGRNDARKFFWSDVDRLANSFAEIPSHILRCKRAPPEIKNTLTSLKSRHPEQMARLPRGSQKVFFRRMWRRLHGNVNDESTNIEHDESDRETHQQNHVDKTDSPSDKNLAEVSPESRSSLPATHSPSSRTDTMNNDGKILLAIAEDSDWLSDIDCFVRSQLEVFCATSNDVSRVQNDRKHPIRVGHVGLRCVHCAACAEGAFGSAISFPDSIGKIYESVRDFQKLHLSECPHVPDHVRQHMEKLKTSTSLTSVLRRYYILAAKALGMVESPHGIIASPESVLANSGQNQQQQSRQKIKRTAQEAQLEDHHLQQQHLMSNSRRYAEIDERGLDHYHENADYTIRRQW